MLAVTPALIQVRPDAPQVNLLGMLIAGTGSLVLRGEFPPCHQTNNITAIKNYPCRKI